LNEAGPGLALLARLAEAAVWDDRVRRHEDDPWDYLRRKLLATEGPLRRLKAALFGEARRFLLEDLAKPFLPPGALQAHKESFESLLTTGDFADLSFHLEAGRERESRLEGARVVLDGAKILTLFDLEAPPPGKRSAGWEKRVEDARRRLGLDLLDLVAARGEAAPRKKAYLARRLRRELDEALAMTRCDAGLRDEVTPYVLARIEPAAAAALRFLARWR